MSKELSQNKAQDVRTLDELLFQQGRQPLSESTESILDRSIQGEVVDEVHWVDPKTIYLSGKVARCTYNRSDMLSLIASIRLNGVIEPVIVRPRFNPLAKKKSEEWECVKGSRRILAAREANVKIPIIIRDLDDISARRINLVTTIQRVDISAYEKSQALVSLQEDMQKELDYWVQESIDAGLVHPTKARNGVQKKPVKIVTAKSWEQIQRDFVEMPAWVRDAFQRSVDRRTPSITFEDVAGQVGLSKDTVQKYFSVAKLAGFIETDKLEKASLPELRMASTIKEPSLQKKFVNAISRGLSCKKAKEKLEEIRLMDKELAAKARFGDSQEFLDAVEYISITSRISEVTKSLDELSKKLNFKERKVNPSLQEALRLEIERWNQKIRFIETRHVNDVESLHK